MIASRRVGGLPIGWLAVVGFLTLLASDGWSQDATPSPHGPLKEECSTCHRPEGWTPVRISSAFDHARKGFALTGAHAQTTCRACHQSLAFRDASADCTSCHEDVHRGELGTVCSKCHTTRSFIDRSAMARGHQLTRFPLDGAHLVTDCRSCHLPQAQGQMVFLAVSTDCVSCHQSSYQSAANPNHVTGGFPTQCSQCHGTIAWTPARFNHDAAGFPLTGAHRAIPCNQCHVGNNFSGTAAQCSACHQTDYNNTTQPNHAQAAFPTDCVSCHTTSSWTAQFNHSTRTQFPLTGAHRAATCQQCHSDGVFQGKSTTCVSCHQPDFNGTTSPNHTAGGFSTTCNSCHTTTAWQPATFDHSATQFPLTGAHKTATCQQCHNDGVYRGKSTQCVSCHLPDYNATTNPAHQGAGFPTACASCHTTTKWAGAVFDHDGPFFPIYSGHHRGVWSSCSSCHTVANDYTQFNCRVCHGNAHSGHSYTNQQCYSCHPRGTAG
jgi:nitrate/TMAO reductase-like tetraheme cytochrome c subunit